MKLLKAHIDGFGIFASKSIPFPNNNLLVVWGENESGKSTLFSFIRGQMAGYPSLRQTTARHYKPLFGGEHGGSIEVALNDATVRINRSAKNNDVSLEVLQGALPIEDGDEELHSLLPRLSHIDYSAIFAFDLDELRALHVLDKTSLNEVLFSAVTSGAEAVVSNASKELEERAKHIFKTRGRSQLTDLYDRYMLVKKEYSDLEEQVKDVRETLRQREPLSKELEAYKSRLSEKQEKLEVLLNAKLLCQQQYDYIVLTKEYIDVPEVPVSEEVRSTGVIAFEERMKALQSKLKLMRESKEKEERNRENLMEECGLFKERLQLADEVHESLSAIAEYDLLIESEQPDSSFYLILSTCFTISTVLLLVILSYSVYTGSLFFIPYTQLLLWMLSLIALILKSRERREKIATFVEELRRAEEKIEDNIKKLSTEAPVIASPEFHITLEKMRSEYVRALTIEEESAARLSSIEEDIKEEEQKLEEIYKEVHASSAEEAIEQITLLKNKEKTKTAVEEAKARLTAEGVSIPKSLAHMTVKLSAVEQDYAQLEKEIDQLSSACKKKEKEFIELVALSKHDTSETRLKEKHQILSLLSAQIQESYLTWAKMTGAQYVLDKALRELTESEYAGVLETASHHASLLTECRYVRIGLRKEKRALFVESLVGKELEISELSRGTVEQIYLAVRLALAQHYVERFTTYPILLDDVLVNFDVVRASAMLKLIQSISKTGQQFILFTCHRWVRELCSQCFGADYGEVNIGEI